jgi:membrane protease YdiL (CAAX protease family)
MDQAKNPNKKLPWHPLLAVLFVVAVFFAAQIVASLIVSIYPLTKHWTAAQGNDWLTSSIWAQFVFVLISEGLILAALYGFLRAYRLNFKAIGLKRLRWRDPAFGLAALPVYFIFYAVAAAVVGALTPSLDLNQQQQIGFQDSHGVVALTLTFISLVILPPIIEEIMMRGLLYGSLREHMPKIAAALITSVIFAAAHLPEGSGGLLWIGFIDTFILSLVLVYLREKTGSLWASITLHGLKNAIAFVSLFILHLS